MTPFRRSRVAVFLAARSLLRGNASVSIMAVAMMTAVFISVMFLPALIAGATDAINTQLVGTLTGDLSITPSGGVAIHDSTSYLTDIRGTEGVAAATGMRRVGNEVSHGSDSVTVGVDAIDPLSYAEVFTTPQHVIEGAYLKPGDENGIFLGIGVAGAGQVKQRTYSISLKTVHAGDTVDVTLLSGQTHLFVVRGIYDNSFPLSGQGAFITTAAADSLVSTTDVAGQIRKAFDALDGLTSALQKAAVTSGSLVTGTGRLSAAMGSMATSADRLASSASTLASRAEQLATGVSGAATAATALATAGRGLASGLVTARDTVGQPAASAASAAAEAAAGVAQSAAVLAGSCPATVPAYCASVAAEAGRAKDAAVAAATSAAATGALATAVSRAAASAQRLADRLDSSASALDALATAASQLVTGTSGLTTGSAALATASDRLHRSVSGVASATADLSSALATGVATANGPDQKTRDELLARLDAAVEAPGKDTVTRIVVRAEPGTNADTLAARLEPLRDDVALQTPAELAAAIQDQLDTFELIDRIMRVLSLLVAAITVLIITFVDLTNRRRQIGIERAIGIRSAAIVGSYVLKSMVTALVGIVLGWLVFRFVLVPLVSGHPFQFPSGPVRLLMEQEVTRANVVILLAVAAVSALLPAIRTVRMRILDAIWGG